MNRDEWETGNNSDELDEIYQENIETKVNILMKDIYENK